MPKLSIYLSNSLNVANESLLTISCKKKFQKLITLLLNELFPFSYIKMASLLPNFLIVSLAFYCYCKIFIGLSIIKRCKKFADLYCVPFKKRPLYWKHSKLLQLLLIALILKAINHPFCFFFLNKYTPFSSRGTFLDRFYLESNKGLIL